MNTKFAAILLTFCLFQPLFFTIAQEKDRPIGKPGKNPQTTPTPTPAPTPTPGPTAEELRRAADQGRADGSADGRREGAENGDEEGRRRGRREGRRIGYNQCEENERRAAFDNGYRRGMDIGARIGADEGQRAGERDGQRKGDDEGNRDGLDAARAEARRAETDRGRSRGFADAQQQTPAIENRAAREGAAAGDAEALKRARHEDYERGRNEYRREQFSLRPRFNESFSLSDSGSPLSYLPVKQDDNALWAYLPPTAADLWRNHAKTLARSQDAAAPTPEKSTASFTYRRNGPRFTTPEEQRAYQNAYRQAYQDSWRRAYQDEFRQTYRQEYRYAYNGGCGEARRLDFGNNYREGHQRGEDEGRRREYDISFRPAFDRSHRAAYQQSYDEAYRAELPRARESVLAETRNAAYKEREQQIYEAAFNRAKEAAFQNTFPRYQTQEYQRGRNDEANDFTLRPARLLKASVAETIKDSVLEPGEDLRLTLSIRNFAAFALQPQDFSLVAATSDGTVVNEAKVNIGRELRPFSVTQVSDSLSFSLPEYALREEFTLALKLFYQGRLISEEGLTLKAQYSAEIKAAGNVRLAEGLPRIMRLTVANRSSLPWPADARLSLRSPASGQVEIPAGEFPLNALTPGEQQTVEVPLIARASGPQVNVPLDVRIEAGPRRLGRLVEERGLTVGNAYKVSINSDLNNLRKSGAARLAYQITNLDSVHRGRALQVAIRFLGETPSNFALPGPNPQYLSPVAPGQTVSFALPVKIAAANSGGVLEFEVREEGQPVIIRRISF